ncbi:hypothetical protein PVAP13_2KG007864 [Panicum virgatum]|uniref:Uncharacterized protein n=1 Tax=Panicum virgatum TaxID=38727 RepID=A0A8T0VYJ7_PANVG|nr:hypothetical protein PVAP13_2KG007864 [Panicum virgatum]
MLQQLNILRKFMYKCYSMLDTFICRVPKKRRTKKIMAFGSADPEEQPRTGTGFLHASKTTGSKMNLDSEKNLSDCRMNNE